VIPTRLHARPRPLLRLRRRRGFTFLEIMVVVAILAILATLVIPNLMGGADKAKIDATVIQIKSLQSALETYRLENSRYPTTEQGLKALVEKPTSEPMPSKWRKYIDEIPKDQWGNDYIYVAPGTKGAYDIISAGPDGKAGTEDDIKSYDLSKAGTTTQ